MSHDDNDDHPENLQATSNVVNLPTGDERVERLAKLSAFEYDRRREAEAKKLGIRMSTLDDAVKAVQEGEDETPVTPPTASRLASSRVRRRRPGGPATAVCSS